MAPPPMTTILAGTWSNESASVLVTLVTPSTGMLGRSMGTLPVARTMFFALRSSGLAPLTLTLPGAVMRPSPLYTVTPFFFIRNATPPVSWVTVLSLRLSMVGRSSFTSPMITPCPAASLLAKEKWWLELRSALLGMQPMRRQVPPRAFSFSMRAVFRPSCAARIAAT